MSISCSYFLNPQNEKLSTITERCLLAVEELRSHTQALAYLVTPRLVSRLWREYVGTPLILRELIDIYSVLAGIDRRIEYIKSLPPGINCEVVEQTAHMCARRLDGHDMLLVITLNARMFDHYFASGDRTRTIEVYEGHQMASELLRQHLSELSRIDKTLTGLGISRYIS